MTEIIFFPYVPQDSFHVIPQHIEHPDPPLHVSLLDALDQMLPHARGRLQGEGSAATTTAILLVVLALQLLLPLQKALVQQEKGLAVLLAAVWK